MRGRVAVMWTSRFYGLLAATVLVACSEDASRPATQPEPGLRIEVTLSDAARDRLVATSEGVNVDASFYGDPNDAAAGRADEVGRISLLNQVRLLPSTGGIATFSLQEIPPERRAWISGPLKVNVNVYSARKAGPDNILSCDFIDGPLPDAARSPVKLNCGLISEGVGTRNSTGPS